MSAKNSNNTMSQKKSVLSASPERNTFQRDGYLERQAEKGLTPDNDADTRAMAEMYQSWNIEKANREADSEWQKNNLEYDLRSTDWMVEKIRASESYAQNLYAAMCNNDFQRQDVWPVLKDETWSCSWRMPEVLLQTCEAEGDYIDWYCSGIRDIGVYAPATENETLTEEQQARMAVVDKFVAESVVTEEIQADLLRLGWAVVTDPNKDY
jgi:hypothetical protein